MVFSSSPFPLALDHKRNLLCTAPDGWELPSAVRVHQWLTGPLTHCPYSQVMKLSSREVWFGQVTQQFSAGRGGGIWCLSPRRVADMGSKQRVLRCSQCQSPHWVSHILQPAFRCPFSLTFSSQTSGHFIYGPYFPELAGTKTPKWCRLLGEGDIEDISWIETSKGILWTARPLPCPDPFRIWTVESTPLYPSTL